MALSAAEFRLLCAFVDHPGRVLSRERLIELTRAQGVEVKAVSLASDGVFGNDSAAYRLATVSGDASNGFAASLTVGIAA